MNAPNAGYVTLAKLNQIASTYGRSLWRTTLDVFFHSLQHSVNLLQLFGLQEKIFY